MSTVTYQVVSRTGSAPPAPRLPLDDTAGGRAYRSPAGASEDTRS